MWSVVKIDIEHINLFCWYSWIQQLVILFQVGQNKKYLPEEKPRYFDPANSVSTPIIKTKMDFDDIRCEKSTPIFDLQKSTSDTKVSPTQSIVKAMMCKGKSSSKKKNYIAASKYYSQILKYSLFGTYSLELLCILKFCKF